MRWWQTLGFLLLLAWFGQVSGWEILGLVLCAAAVHEAGHVAAMSLCGVKPQRFQLSVFGAEIAFDEAGVSYPQELAIFAAGPAADLLCGAALCLAAKRGAGSFCTSGAFWVLGLFNLLPVAPLDGGQILRLGLCWAFGPERGERVASVVSLMCAGVLAGGLCWVMLESRGNLWLLPAALGGMLIAFQTGKRIKTV
ncbi:MAG: site-2 protease family protein [Oscillibacter sp.]|jgi:stage IV sporulation protein FB|nr:site-2 protease family protein [Oscillibacter sp.]